MISLHQGNFYPLVLSVIFIGVISVVPARSQMPAEMLSLDKVLVEGERLTDFSSKTIDPQSSGSTSVDATDLVEDVAGADAASNGPLSGQVQYRGMTGERMNVNVNGHAIQPGGPNWMDPPLHYVPKPLLKNLEVQRGIASVSGGIMTLGGTAQAELLSSEFTDSVRFESSGEFMGSGRSVDDGFTVGGVASYANEERRMHVLASTDQGDDRAFPGGTVKASEYDREQVGFGFGVRDFGDTYSLDYRRTDTGRSGNPSLPMDIEFMETDQVELKYGTRLGGKPFDLQVNYNDVGHGMNNFTLRRPPDFNAMMNPGPAFDGEDRRLVEAHSKDVGFNSARTVPVGNGSVEWGIDYRNHTHGATVYDPDSSFYVEAFDDIEREDVSGYAGWTGPLTDIWDLESGLRFTLTNAEAGRVGADDPIPAGGAVPPPLEDLRVDFNESKREAEDLKVDFTLTGSRSLASGLDLELGLARKTRSPSYIERFGWVPIEATAGMADGNNHIGNRNLDPEVSRDLEIGLDWAGEVAYLAPRVFYRNIDDYIQGTSQGISDTQATVSTVNGDPTPLKYNNVEAEIYGIDASWGYDLPQWNVLSLDGTVSFLRGRRADVSDNLYRFAPPSADVRLNYESES